jgi:DNA-binding HxlR family transcriptional regulator
MANITLSISDELHKKMKQFSEFRWSEIARKAIEERINDLEEMNRIASKSKLTQKDADELGEKIKKGIARRHRL